MTFKDYKVGDVINNISFPENKYLVKEVLSDRLYVVSLQTGSLHTVTRLDKIMLSSAYPFKKYRRSLP